MFIALKYVHLLSLVIWIGSIIFFSFVGAPAIFKSFDRQTAGDIVGVIFPKYFLVNQIFCSVSIVTLALIGYKAGFQMSIKAGLLILALMCGLVAYSSLVNAPQAREAKQQYRAEPDGQKKEELRKKFGKLHGISMALNATTLLLGLILLFFSIKYISISLS